MAEGRAVQASGANSDPRHRVCWPKFLPQGHGGQAQIASGQSGARRQGPSTGFGIIQKMASRENTVWLWVAVAAAAGVAAWALYGLMPGPSDSAHAGAASAPVNLRGDAPGQLAIGNAPGASEAVPMAAGDRFKLFGVMLNGSERSVLVSVDGKPAQMFRVGDTVDGNIMVRDVSDRGASLGPREGGAATSLEVSQAPPPATVAAPMPTAPAVPQAPLADGSAQSREVLRKLGSKHPPLASPTGSTPQKPADGTVAPVDDGRWRPPGQQ